MSYLIFFATTQYRDGVILKTMSGAKLNNENSMPLSTIETKMIDGVFYERCISSFTIACFKTYQLNILGYIIFDSFNNLAVTKSYILKSCY